jgi:succinylarginine dihydrolase
MAAIEVNFDALVGPTHNYAGLAWGNLASLKHKYSPASPKRAALEGLAKMKRVADLGVAQAVLPPPDRPDIRTLRRLGFQGSDAEVLSEAAVRDPVALNSCASASAMWAANAATVSPSADTADGRVHFTPANLVSQFHRSIESATTAAVLRAIFADESKFAHHDPLPSTDIWSDEGAANHTRLGPAFDLRGIEVFVYGRDDHGMAALPRRFPARQARKASEAVARLHRLDPRRTLLIPQNPDAIDAGVFHNDVICVGNENVLLYHEQAFAGPDIEGIAHAFAHSCKGTLHLLPVRSEELSLASAVQTYLFNSQLVTLPIGRMMLIAPLECEANENARHVIDRLIAAENPIDSVMYVDVRQSMRNGGGPACLRLRVILSESERAAVKGRVFLDQSLFARLTIWIEKHYRDELRTQDLADPKLLRESRDALDELTGILGLGAIYEFQAT